MDAPELEDYYLDTLPKSYGRVFQKRKATSVTVFASVLGWEPDNRLRIEGLDLNRCVASALTVGPIELHQCKVEESRVASGHAYFYGTCFSDCSFVGTCGKVWIEDAAKLAMSLKNINRKIVKANQEFYSSVDIAFDLTNAWFDDLELTGIPLEKIRCNPERQLKCSFEKIDRYLRSDLGKDDESDPAMTLRIHRDSRADLQEDFLIASGKRKKSRADFEKLAGFCEDHQLCV